jgi:DNA-binding CsgD family transcriptional regulator/tetratricopeptide (TPR) repeat protein
MPGMDPRRWPLVGREDTVEQVVGLLADRAVDGVLLVGPPGVGTTRVLDEVLDRLRRDGRRVNRVVASPSTVETPYGALAPVIPGSVTGDDGAPIEMLELFERIKFLIGTPRRGVDRFVAAVDDLRWLDERSSALLIQLVAGGLATVLGTLHDDDPLGDALVTLERSCAIRRVRVEPLADDEVAELVRTALHDPVDSGAIHALVAAAQGHPLLLADLLDGSIAATTIERQLGVWSLGGALSTTIRVTSRVEAELARFTDGERQLLETIAVAQPVTIAAVERAGLLDRCADLETQGMLASDQGPVPTVRVASAIVAGHLRHGLSPLRRRLVVPRVVDLIGGAATDDDVVRLTLWRLEIGGTVDVPTLLAASVRARRNGDFVATERVAAAAVEADPSFEALVLHAEALHELCRFAEAEAILDRADRLVDDDLRRLRVAVLRHRICLWGHLDGPRSVAVMDHAIDVMEHPLAIDLARIAIANTVVFTGRPDAVEEVANAMRSGHPLVETGMIFSRTIAATLLGRVDEARRISADGPAARAALPIDTPIGDPALWQLGLSVALVEFGELHAADALLDAATHDGPMHDQPQLHAWIVLERGRAAVFAGRLHEAQRWFAEARAVSERAHIVAGLRLAATGAAMCAAQSGDAAGATEAAAVLTDLPADHGYLWPLRHLGLAWAAAAEGRLDVAIDELLIGADTAVARHEPLLELELLVEAARLGAADTVARRVAELGAVVDGPLSAARLAFVRGLARDDAKELARAEQGFARLDALLWAAESAAELGRVLDDAGRPRDARSAALRADQYRSVIGSMSTPLLDRVSTGAGLSPREREIAEFAAAGTPSKVIAQHLGLSVRTVSNHLQNAYMKLGVSSRDDLGDALRADTSG